MGMCSVKKTSVDAVDDTVSGTELGQKKCWVHSLKPSGNHEEVQDSISGCCLLLVAEKLSYRKPQTFTDVDQNLGSAQHQ